MNLQFRLRLFHKNASHVYLGRGWEQDIYSQSMFVLILHPLGSLLMYFHWQKVLDSGKITKSAHPGWVEPYFQIL